MPGRELERESLGTPVESALSAKQSLPCRVKTCCVDPSAQFRRRLPESRQSRREFSSWFPAGFREDVPSFGKPVVVTRDTTEPPEAMEHGLAKPVGTDERRLFDEMQAYRRTGG